jgi:hypothetical protein
VVHDERAFMEECARRLNGFIATYPDEAQHTLSTYLTYDHELVPVYRHLNRSKPYRLDKAPGATVAALIAALLQTHEGQGWFLQAVILPDPDAGVGCSRIDRFVVARQEPEPHGDPSSSA